MKKEKEKEKEREGHQSREASSRLGQDKIKADPPSGAHGIRFLGRAEHGNEVLLDGEDGVVVEVGVLGIEELGRQRAAAGTRDDEVDVGRAEGVAVEQAEQAAGGPVVGDGVGRRAEAVEGEAAVRVGGEAGAEVHLGLRRVLLLVLAVGGGVPDVEGRVGQGRARRGQDAAGEVRQAGGVAGVCQERGVDDGGVGWQDGGRGAVEGTEDGGRCRGCRGRGRRSLLGCALRTASGIRGSRLRLERRGGPWALLDRGDLVDEGLEAENVAHELRLVARVVAHLAGLVEELDAGHPLIGGELDLTSKVMQVTEEGGHDLGQAGVGISAGGGDDTCCEARVESRAEPSGRGGIRGRLLGTMPVAFCFPGHGRGGGRRLLLLPVGGHDGGLVVFLVGTNSVSSCRSRMRMPRGIVMFRGLVMLWGMLSQCRESRLSSG